MNLLIIHRKERPSQLHTGIQHGEGLRCEHLGSGLREHGFTVQYLCKAMWQHNWAQVIASTLKENHFDAILLLQVDDIHSIPSVHCPIVLDLYAPRLLELAFEPDQGQTSSLLAGLEKADLFLCTHPRQRWHWWGVLALAGVDLREDPIVLVPLAIETTPTKTKEYSNIFVSGGIIWPWESPLQNLQLALEHLAEEEFGQIYWFLTPEQTEDSIPFSHPLLTCISWKHRSKYRKILQDADFALDLSPESPERNLAFGFRHMEYFGCHLPILSTNSNALSESFPNGCLVEQDIKTLLILSQDRVWQEKALQEITVAQEKLSPKTSAEALANWLLSPKKRTVQRSSLLAQAQELQEERKFEEKNKSLSHHVQSLSQECVQKNELIATLNKQTQDYSSTVHRLSLALEEIASFKQDTARVLGDSLHQQQHQISTLQEELTTLKADNAKKTAELQAMEQLRIRLENDLGNLRLENESKKRWLR